MRHPAIADVVRGIFRMKNMPQIQAAAIMLDDIKAMLGVCDDGIRGVRDRAVLLLGFAGGCADPRSRVWMSRTLPGMLTGSL